MTAILNPPRGLKGQLSEADWKSPTGKYVILNMAVGTFEQGMVISEEEFVVNLKSEPSDIARMLKLRAIRFASDFEAEMDKVTILEADDPKIQKSLEETLAKKNQEILSLQSDISQLRSEVSILRRSQVPVPAMTDETAAQLKGEINLKSQRIQDLEQQNQNLNARIAELTSKKK